jgi:hypothetical protein
VRFAILWDTNIAALYLLTHTSNPFAGTPQWWPQPGTCYLRIDRLNSKQYLGREGSFADCPDNPLTVAHELLPIRSLVPDSPKGLRTLDVAFADEATRLLKLDEPRHTLLRNTSTPFPWHRPQVLWEQHTACLTSRRPACLGSSDPSSRRPQPPLRGHMFRCTGGRFWVERHG